MKPSQLQEFLVSKYLKNKGKPMEYFQELFERFQNCCTIKTSFKKQNAKNKYGLTVGYRMS
jgi:hypothetical protein